MPAYFARLVGSFLRLSDSAILGDLTTGYGQETFLSLKTRQIPAWTSTIPILKQHLELLMSSTPSVANWGVALEYPIPRREGRIDAVLLTSGCALVLEFKEFFRADPRSIGAAIDQVEDYARDLVEFHKPSHYLDVVPILVLQGPYSGNPLKEHRNSRAQITDETNLATCITNALGSQFESSGIDELKLANWNGGQYQPVPTILDAAADLYANNDVRDIAHASSDPGNLSQTRETLVRAIEEARSNGHKVICFVTGVPGSGKTLAGLNLVHDARLRNQAAFLSGNGPLVKILRESLANDQYRRLRDTGKRILACRREVKTFIQNVHVFLKTNLGDDRPPHETVVIFDEAQRAWDEERVWTKNKRRQSEPETILEIMDRHPGWAGIIALVGGGQEIYKGEAGLSAWGDALREKYKHWKIYASPEAVSGGTSVAGLSLNFTNEMMGRVIVEKTLHLAVSVRSIRSEKLATWVNAVLEGNADRAREVLPGEYPLFLTRDLQAAKSWLLNVSSGTRRYGLVASSGGKRLRADGIEVSSGFRGNYPYTSWFLASKGSLDSSYQLEVPATEFEIQGLELDWVALCWSADLCWQNDLHQWFPRRIHLNRWTIVKSPIDRQFAVNRYRVLMTRARQGMVIWVPRGDPDDPTRKPHELDAIADFLARCGMRILA